VGYNAIAGGASVCITAGAFQTASGGISNNITSSGYGNTIGGGGGQNITGTAQYSFIGGGNNNSVSGSHSSAIGLTNTVSNGCSHIHGTGLTSSAGSTFYTNALSKTSGTFRISHPDPSKTATKYLQHSLVESPTRGDNIYRYEICAVGCAAILELPSYYKFLNENDQVWVTPKNHFGVGYGIVDETQSCVTFTTNADGEYNVLIIGTRKDIDAMNGFTGLEQFK
jgi:hypothetical protein